MRTKSACHICKWNSLAIFASSSENANFFSARNSSVDGWYNLHPNLGFFAGTILSSSRTSFLSQCLHLLSSNTTLFFKKNLSHSELKTSLVRAKTYDNGNAGHVPF